MLGGINKERKMKSQFNELLVLAEKVKKKGGSMAAVFKLIQDLLDFEEKIQDCVNSQEMAENRQKIEAFLVEIDKMYDVMFEMARGGISEIRNDRVMGEGLGTVEDEEEVEIEGDGRMDEIGELRDRLTEVTTPEASKPSILNAPKAPSM